jgi:glutathione synthase/RimK-type ligase-like ATP-grasp enzyme
MPTLNAISTILSPTPGPQPHRPRIAIAVEPRYLDQRQPAGFAAALVRAGHPATLLDPEAPGQLSEIDLLIARGRSPALLDLLARAEAAGIPTLNRRAAIAAVLDKSRVALALAEAGVPSPRTWVGSIEELRAQARPGAFPLVVKPVCGDNARGVQVVWNRDALARLPWSEPLILAQPFIPGDGFDLKLYVAGGEVWAARKPSPIGDEATRGTPAQPVPVTATLRALALTCGMRFGLELFGVDCIETPVGPVVIEVNDFPNYSGIDCADDALARLAVERAARAGRVRR